MNFSKKSIATVLAIIMVSSLTTVAFAATNDTTYSEATAPTISGANTIENPVFDKTAETELNTMPTAPTEIAESTTDELQIKTELSEATNSVTPTGDVNSDNKLSLSDIALLQSYISDKIKLSDAQLTHAKLDRENINLNLIFKLQKSIADSNSSSEIIIANGISLSKTALTLDAGDVTTIIATVKPTNATIKDVNYSSNNTKIATVSSAGIITAKSSGNVVISAKTKDGDYKATCDVTVKATSSLAYSGFKNMPNNKIIVGTFHNLIGTVTSNFPITSIRCVIEGTNMDKTVKIPSNKNTKSYGVYDAFDEAMAFSDAGIGTHTFKVYATDTQKTASTLLYSYKYTIVAAEKPSGATKTLVSGGATYYVPSTYSSNYLYDQRDYSKFNWGSSNVGCSATAEAIGASILSNKRIAPDNSQIIWTSNGAGWGLASVRYCDCSLDMKLKTAYDQLMKGRPSIINTFGGGGSDHWITFIGIKQGANRNNLSTSDFLIANPWGGSINNLTLYLNSCGRYIPYDYSLRCYR